MRNHLLMTTGLILLVRLKIDQFSKLMDYLSWYQLVLIYNIHFTYFLQTKDWKSSYQKSTRTKSKFNLGIYIKLAVWLYAINLAQNVQINYINLGLMIQVWLFSFRISYLVWYLGGELRPFRVIKFSWIKANQFLVKKRRTQIQSRKIWSIYKLKMQPIQK